MFAICFGNANAFCPLNVFRCNIMADYVTSYIPFYFVIKFILFENPDSEWLVPCMVTNSNIFIQPKSRRIFEMCSWKCHFVMKLNTKIESLQIRCDAKNLQNIHLKWAHGCMTAKRNCKWRTISLPKCNMRWSFFTLDLITELNDSCCCLIRWNV